ncbi:MAG: LuxR C-terminal-related transcriptional regulator [Hafnia sp.]
MIKIHVLSDNYFLRTGVALMAVKHGYRVNVLHPENDCDLSGLGSSDRVVFHIDRADSTWLPRILTLSSSTGLMLISAHRFRLDALCKISETVDERAPLPRILSSLKKLADTNVYTPVRTPNYRLSRRERRVLTETLMGTHCDRIAEQLCISPRTVYVHRQNACKKLGADTFHDILPLKSFILEWDRCIHQNSR